MADITVIRPDALPPSSGVNPSSAIAVDNGSAVEKATPIQIVNAAVPLATQEAAETGAGNDDRMSSLRVKQAIDALGVSSTALSSGIGASLVGEDGFGNLQNFVTRDVENAFQPELMPSWDNMPNADNTQAIIDAAVAMGNVRKIIRISPGTVYDKSAIQASPDVPPRVLFEDRSGVNGGYPGAGVFGFFDRGDPTSADDTTMMQSSGHNATFTLDNSGLAGSHSGQARTAALYWTGGNCQKGALPKLRRNIASLEWALSSSEEWALQMRKKAPAQAIAFNLPNHGYWRWASGVETEVGEFCCHNAGGVLRYYVATSSGTTGSTPPTHSSGSVSDGGVTWEYVIFNYDGAVFQITNRGRIGVNSAPPNGVYARFRNSPEAPDENQVWQFQPLGTNRQVMLDCYPTDGSGEPVVSPVRLQALSTGWRFLVGGNIVGDFNANGFQQRARTMVTPTAPDGEETPSVAGVSSLLFNNSADTPVTNLTGAVANQEVELVFQNGNTTLVNGAGFALQGGTNVTPTANSVITVRRVSYTSAWIEVSRSIK